MKICRLQVLIIALLVTLFTSGHVLGDEVRHSGYVSDVNEEREGSHESIFVVFDIEKPKESEIKDRIFHVKIKREIVRRYKNTFGQTPIEQQLLVVKPHSYYFDDRGNAVTSKSIHDREKRFGEYMIRRLLEFHLDHQLKEEPTTRPIYDFKERVRKTEVKIAKGYKLESQYSISSNSIKVELENPYVDFRASMDLNKTNGTTDADEALLLSFYRKITSSFRMESHVKTSTGELRVIGRKKISKPLTFTLTIVPNKEYEEKEEVHSLAGIHYKF